MEAQAEGPRQELGASDARNSRQEMGSSSNHSNRIRNRNSNSNSSSSSNNNNNNGENENNNDECFANEYPQADKCEALDRRRSSSGGSTSGSPSSESAFSSASSECEDDATAAATTTAALAAEADRVSPCCSSGRSSASNKSDDQREQLAQAAQLNSVANLAPASGETRELVEKIRLRFLAKLADGSHSRQLFDELDLSEMKRELPADLDHQEQALAFRFTTRFINFHHIDKLRGEGAQQAIDEIVERLAEFLKFRKQYQLSHVLLDQFCKEIYHLHGIFPFGRDKNHLPVMYMRARVHRRWSHKLDEAFRRYVAWQVDLITKSYAGANVSRTIGRNAIEKDGSFGICFDCLHVSYSCVDMDFLSYLVKILVNYYPTYCRYALCVDLPWLFRSVWKLVRSWLPEDARNTVQLITSRQLTDFIEPDQVPNCIRTNDLDANEKPASGRHRVPEDFQSIQDVDQFARTLKLSSSEVKQFKAHVDKVLKEYKQSGAV